MELSTYVDLIYTSLNADDAGSPSAAGALLRGNMKICRCQTIPVHLDAQTGPRRCNHPPLVEQVAVFHSEFESLLGHRSYANRMATDGPKAALLVESTMR